MTCSVRVALRASSFVILKCFLDVLSRVIKTHNIVCVLSFQNSFFCFRMVKNVTLLGHISEISKIYEQATGTMPKVFKTSNFC